MTAEDPMIKGGDDEENITQYLPICGEGYDCSSVNR